MALHVFYRLARAKRFVNTVMYMYEIVTFECMMTRYSCYRLWASYQFFAADKFFLKVEGNE